MASEEEGEGRAYTQGKEQPQVSGPGGPSARALGSQRAGPRMLTQGVSLGEEAAWYFLGEAEEGEPMGSTVERWDRMEGRTGIHTGDKDHLRS